MRAMGTTRPVYGHEDLRRLIAPKVVAVVGASPAPGSFGERTLSNLSGFAGTLYGVNPKYTEANGVPCFPSVTELPETPDCVIVAVAAKFVEGILTECADRGVGGAIVYASGFAELGTPEAIAAQERLVAIGREGGVRIVGPNCVGLVNTHLRAGLNFMAGFQDMKLVTGPVSLVSQSGGLGYTMFQGMERGVGIGHYLAAGNSADVDVCDYVSYLADDPDTKVIACLFEGVKDGNRLVEAAERARDRGKPLLVYKMGTGETARQTAMSHTGTLVGAQEAYRAAFERTGAIAIDRLDGLLETANFFARSGAPRSGRGVGVMATSGGAAVVTADKADQHGVPLPQLSPATAEALKEFVPGFGSIANPADLTAEVLKTRETFVGCFEAFAADPSFDALIVPLVFASAVSSGARTPLMSEMARRTGLPIVGIWMNDWLQGPGSEVLDADAHASIFRSTDHCFEALANWFRWHRRRAEAQARGAPVRLSGREAGEAARAALTSLPRGTRSPDEVTAKDILARYGVGVLKERLAKDADDAARAAQEIGFPVALKIASPDIAHKTEAGGVVLNLADADAVRAAFAQIAAAAKAYAPSARIEGCVVQEMVPGGLELVLGARIDAQFGPLVAVGLGGTLVELLRDTAVGLAPVSAAEAREMLESLKGAALLKGYRGSEPVDVDALAGQVARFSEFVADAADLLEEVDVNPVIVRGARAVAVDALIVTKEQEGRG